ncbi:hypothetical protein TEQG_02010 [Trichophyton equinum CBS 127.97]|uniref:Uncharacterized protein n=1 Tax=Trichophyton equinum (strain ATCC MYA-4606 / CBS 127.97) TaxID=559882 RepID=F2PM54_TRIEC|nr:hypothetical protein TEQG_02010 [Trichophyton equinum CBS 127.97]
MVIWTTAHGGKTNSKTAEMLVRKGRSCLQLGQAEALEGRIPGSKGLIGGNFAKSSLGSWYMRIAIRKGVERVTFRSQIHPSCFLLMTEESSTLCILYPDSLNIILPEIKEKLSKYR